MKTVNVARMSFHHVSYFQLLSYAKTPFTKAALDLSLIPQKGLGWEKMKDKKTVLLLF